MGFTVGCSRVLFLETLCQVDVVQCLVPLAPASYGVCHHRIVSSGQGSGTPVVRVEEFACFCRFFRCGWCGAFVCGVLYVITAVSYSSFEL